MNSFRLCWCSISLVCMSICIVEIAAAYIETPCSQYHRGIILAIVTCSLVINSAHPRITKRSYSDQSVHGYMTERTCWWNEVCKEEFQNMFRCKCPQWSYCRSPGRYYNAYCSMTNTGYIWTQPTWDWGP